MEDSARTLSLVERALYLRTVPQFAQMTPDQVTVFAEHVREVFIGPGASLFEAGDFARELFVIVEGSVRLEGEGFSGLVGPRGAVGAPAVFEHTRRFYTATAETDVFALGLREEDLFDVFEDHFDVARLAIRNVARGIMRLRKEVGILDETGEGGGEPFRACSSPGSADRGPLDLVEKIVFLKSLEAFAGFTVAEFAQLAEEITEEHVEAGQPLFEAGRFADTFWLVLRGKAGPYGPRWIAGALAAYAQTEYSFTAVAEEPCWLLRVPSEAYFDILEDHFDMTRMLMTHLGRRLRTLNEAVARAGGAFFTPGG